ncbi:MAG TPA: DUF4880 domain-containing protein [Gammaproteobacteria bacterium]|nr:DUF4880 domain-containing protein [Gammaproteobacteria bacterium]
MNNQPNSSPSERDQQALDWWTRLRADNVSAQQRNAFELWRAEPLNANAYQNVETLWTLLERPAHAVRRTERRRPLSRWATYAAAACLVLAFATVMLMTPPMSTWGSDYATATGQQQDITLADGSRLHLDSDSAVDITLNSNERRVNLLRGRVFLDVSHDGRPFVVRAGGADGALRGLVVEPYDPAALVAHQFVEDVPQRRIAHPQLAVAPR